MKCFCFWLAIFLTALRAQAVVTATVTSLSITNGSEFLIAADALTNAPGTERDAVQVRAVVRWTNDAISSVVADTTYELRLLVGTSAASIITESGATGTIFRITNSVSVPGGFSGGSIGLTNFFSLKPVGQLNPFTNYTAQLILLNGVKKLDTAETTERQFWHFTNLVSGDVSLNVLGSMETNSWDKTYAIDTVVGQESFQVSNTFRILRFDDFNAASAAANIPVRLSWQLQDTNGAVISTTPASTNFTVSVLNHENTTPVTPRDRTFSRVISFQPNSQLDSVSNRYRLVVTLAVTNIVGQAPQIFNSATTPNTQLQHFNGNLVFGNATATWTNLTGTPTPLPTPPGSDYLNTQIDGRGAFLGSEGARSFDIAGPRTFRLRANGDAVLPSGTINLPIVFSGDYFTNNNFRIRRGTVTLTTNGPTSDVTFYLPAGFGLTTNYSATRKMESRVVFQDAGLDSALEPRTNLFLAQTFVASSESKPMFIVGDRFEWSANLHRFTITPNSTFPAIGIRFTDEALLLARSNLLASADQTLKRANDGYYRFVNGFTGNVILTAGAGNIAQLAYTATFGDGTFSPHFPLGPSLSWTNGGKIQISANSVIPGANSRLEGAQGITQRYLANCIGCDGSMTTNSLGMGPTNQYLNFTRDGGLVAIRDNSGFSLPQELSWGLSTNTGTYAHRALAVQSQLSFLMSGHFLRGADNTGSSHDAPGVLHLTGVAATNLSVIERPLTSGYDTVGRADYAGMNARSTLGTPLGRDVITGTQVDFTRTSRCKYYARFAGISGIHEAVSGSFDSTLTLLGYPFTFDKYGFSFRDSQMLLSRTDGSVSVPYPAQITLPFQELTLTCAGGLDFAQLPASVGYRNLVYWNADILPQSLRFEGQPGQECDPTKSYLVLGVQAHASYAAQPLAGTIGFFANGSLIPPSFNLPGVDSRFELPSQFRFAGPQGSGDWVMTPVAPAYFTTNEMALAPNGYLNLAGEINAPFFENIKVHLHTGARTNGAPGSANIYLAGGWPRAGQNNIYGWEENNEDYFRDVDFDKNNRGFPAGVSLASYHGGSNETYRARAERMWLDTVKFDYPLAWDSALRTFSTFKAPTTELFVVEAKTQVSHLDPKNAIIDIGERYEGLPVVTLSHFLVDEGGSGAATAMRNAIGSSAYTKITNGLAHADTLLSENPTRFTDHLMAADVDAVVTNLVNELTTKWNAVKNQSPNVRATFTTNAVASTKNHFFGGSGVTDTIRLRLRHLGDPAFNGKLFAALSSDISLAADGINQNATSFNGGATGATAIRQLVALSAPQFANSVAGPELEAALAKNASAFQQLSEIMQTSRSTISDFGNSLNNENSEWHDELENLWTANISRLETMTTNAMLVVSNYLTSFNYRVDDPFTGNGVNEVCSQIRAAISDRLLGEPVIAAVRSSVKQRLFDLNENYRSAANSVFGQYNAVARDLISRSLAQVDNHFTPALDTLGTFFEISRLQGHAEIQDESLRELRLDGRMKLKSPDDIIFNAFLEIKELTSENTPEECLYSGGTATEVKFGATDVDLDWISDDLRANVSTKITLVNGVPKGIAGSFETVGDIEFAGFVIKKVGFALAAGEEENYLAANARVKLGKSSEIAGGLFFGRACSIDPLVIAVAGVSPFLLNSVNPHDIFGNPPFTGGFVYAEGTFPVFSLGCLFEVRLTAGAGAWFFVEGPRYGGIIKAGVSGTVICVLSVSGDITLIGAKKQGAMTFVGLAHVEGCIGFWPLEICVDADTSVTYTQGLEWEADEP